MMNAIVISFRFLFSNKWKILLTLFLSVVFLVLLFPLSDLNDLISSQVSKLTNNKVFLQFDKMSLNPLSPSVSFEKLYVETPQISGLTSDELSVSPSISALISKKPGGTVTAKGFLKGELEISMSPAPANGGVDKSKIDISASNLSLNEARQMANLSLPIKGQLSLSSQAVADLTLTEQPEVDLSLTVLKFEMASAMVPFQDGLQLQLPEINFEKIELKGRLSNGKMQIETGKLGTNKDDFYGEIKGDLALTFQNMGGQVVPVVGAYNITLDLKANTRFQQRAKLFLGFLDGSKVSSGAINNYKLRIQASAMGMPPQITPLK